ncbi:pentatricopeptide repeat-containing protein ELI1, chloroplastic [Tanacetum coccineum]
MLPPPIATTAHHPLPPPLPSPETLTHLLTTTKTLKHLTQIHAAIIRHGYHTHPIINFKLQRSYTHFNRLDHSTALFNLTHKPNVYFYTSIIQAHADEYEKMKLYAQMLMDDVGPTEYTFSAVLKDCGVVYGRMVHGHVVKFGFGGNLHVRSGLVDVYGRGGEVANARKVFDEMPEKSLVLWTGMVTGYVKCGEVGKARVLFDEMVERDAVCWNVMIGGYAKYGKAMEALSLFRRMLGEKMSRPDEVTLVTVLSACGQVGALESGRWVHSYMRNSGMQMNVHLGTALIDMYGKCGSLEDARVVFDKLKNKDVIAYNSMITCYAMHGHCQEALQLFSDMCRMHTTPTDISFIGILSACAHSGLVSIGKGFFLLMREKYMIEPTSSSMDVWLTFWPSGYLEEGIMIVKEHVKVALTSHMGTLLDSRDMKHPNSKKIYMMLEEVNGWLKDNGYSPQTDIVLHDFENKDRARSLEVHSEKLAVAFGLISTEAGSSIKIVKNLRICLDCHEVMKLISKLARRRIVIRDRNRFHHFVDGLCSCGDYW